MKTTRAIYNWIIRNLSNVFGLIGIVLTIYFGSVYVPAWNKENQNEKLNSAKRQSIQSIKEIIFSDSLVSVGEIKTIVYAKELEEKVTIPYTFYEILTLTQNSFMEDKFLPLDKRKELINKIDQLKTVVLPEQAQEEVKNSKSQKSYLNLSAFLSIIISLLAGFAGLTSLYIKIRLDKDKQEEIANEIEQSTTDISFRDFAVRTEKEFIDAIREVIGVDAKVLSRNEGYDLQFNKEGRDYYVEFKLLTKSKVGLGSFKQFLYSVKDYAGEAWFIYNTDLTPLVLQEAKAFSDNNKQTTLRLLKVRNKKELQDRVKDLLHMKRT
jgi:hypothetical protein